MLAVADALALAAAADRAEDPGPDHWLARLGPNLAHHHIHGTVLVDGARGDPNENVVLEHHRGEDHNIEEHDWQHAQLLSYIDLYTSTDTTESLERKLTKGGRGGINFKNTERPNGCREGIEEGEKNGGVAVRGTT